MTKSYSPRASLWWDPKLVYVNLVMLLVISLVATKEPSRSLEAAGGVLNESIHGREI